MIDMSCNASSHTIEADAALGIASSGGARRAAAANALLGAAAAATAAAATTAHSVAHNKANDNNSALCYLLSGDASGTVLLR